MLEPADCCAALLLWLRALWPFEPLRRLVLCRLVLGVLEDRDVWRFDAPVPRPLDCRFDALALRPLELALRPLELALRPLDELPLLDPFAFWFWVRPRVA